MVLVSNAIRKKPHMNLTTNLQCIAEDDTGHYPAAAKVACAAAAAAIERLTAENERLRAALQQIADEEDIFNYGYTLPKIAKDALHQQLSVNSEEGK